MMTFFADVLSDCSYADRSMCFIIGDNYCNHHLVTDAMKGHKELFIYIDLILSDFNICHLLFIVMFIADFMI